MFASIVEKYKIVEAITPTAANAITTACDYVSLKNIHKAWVVVNHYSAGGDTDAVFGVREATAVAGTGVTAITTVMPGWLNTDTSASDTLTKQTSAATYTIDTGAAKPQLLVIEVDPAILSAGFDVIQAYETGGGNAANYASVIYILEPRYPQAVPPTAITD